MSADDGSVDLDHVDPAVRALLPKYLRRRFADVITIRDLLEAGNFTELGRLAHNMRGSGGAYGLPKISAIGAHMEIAAKQQDAAAIVEQLQDLEKFLPGISV